MTVAENENAAATPAPTDPRDDHPAGVARVLWIMAILAAIAGVPYLVPGLERVQPWQPGGRVPFAGLFEFKSPVQSAIAGVARKQEVSLSDDDLLASAPLPEASKPSEPRESPAAQPAEVESLRIDPSEYAAMTRAIEGPDGAMEHFYRRLMAVARDEPGAVARVAVYSDSINGADRVSSAMRKHFQDRFGDAGKGWVPISPGWRYHRHQDVEWSQHRRWRTYVVNRGNGPLDRYGLGGVLSVNVSPKARATFATAGNDEVAGHRVSRFELFYQAWPEGGDVLLSVDGNEPERLSTRSASVEDRTHTIEVPDGKHALELEVPDRGSFRGYGVVMEREGPGVVVDGLQLIGAFARVLRNWDVDHWQDQIRTRGTDLMVFWLGGNDAVSSSVPFIHDRFVESYAEVLRRARGGRSEASCLVISVLDSADKVDGRIRSHRRVPRLVEAQKQAADRAGCAFLDAYEATGGRGTMRRWYRSSPRLVTTDYRHLTEAGARVVGSLYYEAILEGYDRFLASL
ncbi:MAG: GDSL-type esterase/lipase family protein [Myxococcota bacterium]